MNVPTKGNKYLTKFIELTAAYGEVQSFFINIDMIESIYPALGKEYREKQYVKPNTAIYFQELPP